jgi:hypothetical protein
MSHQWGNSYPVNLRFHGNSDTVSFCNHNVRQCNIGGYHSGAVEPPELLGVDAMLVKYFP